MKLPLLLSHHRMPSQMARKCLPALLGLALSGASLAGDAPNYDEDNLLGGWGGAREQLSSRGMDFELGYRIDQMSVVSGGNKQGGRPVSHLDLKFKLDFEKALGWQGLTGFVNFIDDRGGKPNADYAGSLIGVTNIEVPVATSRFFHAWLQKEWADGQFSVLGGLYPIDSEFMVVESAGVFNQPAFGALGDLALTRGPSIFNNPAVGVRAKWTSSDRRHYVQGAVLDGIPGDPNHAIGTRVKFGSNDGVMGIVEIGRRYTPGGIDVKGEDEEMVSDSRTAPHELDLGSSKFAAGLWSYSKRSDDLVDLDSAGNPAQRQSIGWYVLGEKALLKETVIGDVSLFGRYSQNDGNSNPLKRTLNLGVNLKGTIKGRDDDVLALGYTHAVLSPKYRDTLNAAGTTAAKYEGAWELTYRAQVTKWLAVQPVAQLIQNPNGEKSRQDVTVLGLRMDVIF